MNKYLLGAVLSSVCSFSYADAVGLYMGAGGWAMEAEGYIGDQGATTTIEDLGLGEKQATLQLWANLEHPVPILPNFRVAHSIVEADAYSTTSQQFQLGGFEFSAEIDTYSELSFTYTDGTLYYELLDNYFSFDLGITVRYLDGYLTVVSELTNPTTSNLQGVLPMGYANIQIDIPGTGLYFAATGNGISFEGDKATDYLVKVGYFFDVTAFEFGFNVGYRELRIEAEELDNLNANAKASGPFAEFVVHF